MALVSFLLTLWLIEPHPALQPSGYKAPDIGPLAAQHVAAYEDLRRAASEAGLKLSLHMKGHVDTISRINDREVAVAGWLADPEYGDGTPLRIIVFVGGPVVGRTDTKGDRPDVTHALGLEFGSEKNVAFRLNFACRPADQPVLIGLGSRSQYLPLPIGPCP